jgi:hypothetical protein
LGRVVENYLPAQYDVSGAEAVDDGAIAA